MLATDSYEDTEIAGVGDEGCGVRDSHHRQRHRRRGRSNPPTNEAVYNDYSNSAMFTDELSYYGGSTAAFTDFNDQPSAHFDYSSESSGVNSYNDMSQRLSVSEIDLESGELEEMMHGRQCRICHLNSNGSIDEDDDDDDDDDDDLGEPLELGCDCRGDLGTAHRKCAVTWFFIKGDLTCEICGSIAEHVFEMAQNFPFEQIRNMDNVDDIDESFVAPVLERENEHRNERERESESESSSDRKNVMNVLLTCIVLSFLLTVLFRTIRHGEIN